MSFQSGERNAVMDLLMRSVFGYDEDACSAVRWSKVESQEEFVGVE
jgi:hypothetical protein